MCTMKNHSKIIWIVIRIKMLMTKINKNMDCRSYRNVYDEKPYKKDKESHLYKDVHDENPLKKNMDSHL